MQSLKMLSVGLNSCTGKCVHDALMFSNKVLFLSVPLCMSPLSSDMTNYTVYLILLQTFYSENS